MAGPEGKMTPGRCASELSKMIARFTRAKHLPEGWASQDFISLLEKYVSLVKVIESKPATPVPETTDWENLDSIMMNGREGAYEALVQRAQMVEEVGKTSKGKKKR